MQENKFEGLPDREEKKPDYVKKRQILITIKEQQVLKFHRESEIERIYLEVEW